MGELRQVQSGVWEPEEFCDAKDGPCNHCYMNWEHAFVSFKDKLCVQCFGDFELGENERLYEDDMRLDAAAGCRLCLEGVHLGCLSAHEDWCEKAAERSMAALAVWRENAKEWP